MKTSLHTYAKIVRLRSIVAQSDKTIYVVQPFGKIKYISRPTILYISNKLCGL